MALSSPFDIVLDVDDETGGGSSILGLNLVRDGKPAWLPATSEPAERSERVRYFENHAKGAGYSRESTESQGGIAYGEWIDDTQAGVITPAGEIEELVLPPEAAGGYVRDAFEFDGQLYLLMDRRWVFSWPNKTGSTIQIAVDYLAGATTQYGVVFNGKAYISFGANGSIGIGDFDGTTWRSQVTHGVGAAVTRLQMAKVYWTISDQLATGGLAGASGVGDWFLVALDAAGENFILCAGDPFTTANWSSPYPVGDSTYAAQRMVWSNRYVAVARPDGVYSIDELGYTPNLTPWVEKVYHGNNGSSVEYWNGAVWYGTNQGLAWVPLTGERQDVPVFVQFGDGASNETPIYGFPRCMAPGHDRLWVGMHNGSTGYVMAVRLGPDGRPRWHGAFAKFSGETPTFLREVTTTAGHRTLLIGTHDGTNPQLYAQSLPQSGQPLVDYRQGTSHRFATSWQINYPISNFGSWAKKTGRRGSIVAALLGGGNSIALKTAVDTSIDSGTYTTQGTAATSPRSAFTFSGALAEGVDFAFRIDGSSLATKPVAVRAVELRTTAHPETVTVYTARVKIAASMSRRLGTLDDDVDPIIDLAKIKAKERAGPIGMVVPPIGAYYPSVKVEAGTSPVLREDAHTKEWYWEVQLTITILEDAYRYDVDAYYDGAFYL